MLAFDQTRVPVFSDKIAAYVGKDVIMGIRPEDLHIEPNLVNSMEDAVITADIDLDEMMGSEIYLYFEIGGKKMISRIPSKFQVKAGDRVKLAVDPGRVHVFDKETEQVICQ